MFDEILKIVSSAFMGAFGALTRLIVKRNGKKIRLRAAFLSMTVGIFIGVMVCFLANYMKLDVNLAILLSGALSAMGDKGVYLLLAAAVRASGIAKGDGE